MVVSRREVLVWCVLGIGVLALVAGSRGGPAFGNDSYQYLSGAANLMAGKGISTSIIHFDIERTFQRTPAPLTTFPPGYSIAIAAISSLGLPREQSGFALSVASFLAIIPLLARAARVLGISPMVTRLILLGMLFNSWANDCSIQIATEALFTALSTAAVVLLLELEANDASPSSTGTLVSRIIAHGLIGMAFAVRFAGMFLFAAVTLYYAVRLVLRPSRKALLAVGCSLISGAIIASVMFRNFLLTSTWRGGNGKQVFHPVGPVLKELVTGIIHLGLGSGAGFHMGLGEISLVLSAASILLLGVLSAREAATRPEGPRMFNGAVALMGTYLVVYAAGMTYLGVFSVISFGTRMFLPLLPLLLLTIGLFATRLEDNARLHGRARFGLLVATTILSVSYVGLNLRSSLAYHLPSPHRAVLQRFGEVRAWVDANVPKDAVLVGTADQGTSYAFQRPVVSLLESEYSNMVWTEAAVEKTMETYGAEYLVLFPDAKQSEVPAQTESAFLAGILRGELPPWLSLAVQGEHVKVFRRRPRGVERPPSELVRVGAQDG